MARPVMLLGLPVLFIFLAAISLNQFKVAYTLFTQLVHWNGAHPLWNQTARPLLQQLLFLLETTLGPVQKLAFSMTHILLTALMLVIVIYVEKLREAIISANQR